MGLSYAAWRDLLAEEPLPAAVVDMDALDANVATLLGALGPGPTLRVASKSIRCPALLRHLLDADPRIEGLMTWSAHETAWLARQGFDDLLLAYPIGRPDEARALAEAARPGTRLLVTIDALEQAERLSRAAEAADTTLSLCIDVDVSLRLAGGRAHLGVRRSPIRDVEGALALARAVRRLPRLRLRAVLAYEAQVAGLPDVAPGADWTGPVRRWIKSRSVGLAADRRAAIRAALEADGETIDLVNGGGTGSVASTSADPSVTEVTAGSGFVCPHLFDGYRGLPLQPALFFALGVVRSSDPDHVTCAGGGYVASGSAGPDRLPRVHLPEGLEPLGLEGFGEVQTPFRVRGERPRLGDPVVCRHAKAGELAERFDRYLLVRDGRIVDRVPTLRGAGMRFF